MSEAVANYPCIAFDTSILVELWKAPRLGVAPQVDLTKIPAAQRSVPSIVAWEFYRDERKPLAEIRERRRWIQRTFLSSPLLRLDRKVEDALRAMLARKVEIDLPDALIAATCIAWKAPLLTLNRKHFLGFAELRLIALTAW